MEGLGVFIKDVTTGIVNIFKAIGDILNYLNPFSDKFILKEVLSFFGNLLSYINPFSDNFIGYKIIELLGNLLESLFVPKQESINGLVDTVKSKFGFIDSISSYISSLKDIFSGVSSVPSYSVHVEGTKYTSAQDVTVLDLSWLSPYKKYTDPIITGFVYIFFLWNMYIKLPNIISGFGGDVVSSTRYFDNFSKKG